jgi:hypothetical protein
MYNDLQYDMNKKRVRQKLHSVDSSDFEGTFDYILEKVQKTKEYYIEKYGTEPTSVRVHDSYYPYADGTKEKKVMFDSFEIESTTEYGDRVHNVYGSRDFLPEEVEAFKKKQETEDEKRKKEELKILEALKKKYES